MESVRPRPPRAVPPFPACVPLLTALATAPLSLLQSPVRRRPLAAAGRRPCPRPAPAATTRAPLTQTRARPRSEARLLDLGANRG